MFLLRNKVLKNATWIVGCKIIQSLISFIIGIFTARYLGPSNYGLISYAASLVAFFVPIMQLGLPDILVKEFISHPEDEGKILGTSLVFNIISAFASIIGIFTFSLVANAGDKTTTLVCLLYSLTLIFQATEMTLYWFQAKLLSKFPSIASLVAYTITALYKVYILLSGKSIVWFAITHVIEACVISILLLLVYFLKFKHTLSFSFSLGIKMISRSKHYISSGLMIVVFQQTDKIMIKFLLGETETGFYSSAITCIAITGFLFSAIIDSARPWVLEGKSCSNRVFEERVTVLSSVVVTVSLLQSIFMTLLADYIVLILYGEQFLPAAGILRVAVWYVTFSYIGNVRNVWILGEEKQKYLPVINIIGASANVLLNALLIPVLGAAGAALASVCTQFFTNFVLSFAIKSMRPAGFIIIKSFDPRIIFNLLKKRAK